MSNSGAFIAGLVFHCTECDLEERGLGGRVMASAGGSDFLLSNDVILEVRWDPGLTQIDETSEKIKPMPPSYSRNTFRTIEGSGGFPH
jgi:hypothetical protein